MAPPKGLLPQRILGNNFLGINWTKVCWQAPYSNFYPFTMTAGMQGRMWSSPLAYGNKEHRMSYIWVRSCILGIPTAYLSLIMFLQADWYQIMAINYWFLLSDPPQWAQEQYAKEMKAMTREKPGALLKHKYGGQVSIPGSEINIS
jgi:hypothetical protein